MRSRRLAVVPLALMLSLGNGCALTESGIVPLEHAVVFQPAGPPPADWELPDFAHEDVYFESGDGTRLHGWYCPVEEPRAYVLFMHGNAGNLAHRAPDFERLTKQLRVTVLGFDYRGYGHSRGKPSESGVLEDARAARRWLAQRVGIAESEVVLFGRSLGGGIAVDLAAKDGARGLILESTFESLPAVANDVLPLWPGLLMFNRFDSLSKIADYHGPLLIAHGTADRVVPYQQGQSLFEAANEPKQFITIKDGGHNWEKPERYVTELAAFFDSLES